MACIFNLCTQSDGLHPAPVGKIAGAVPKGCFTPQGMRNSFGAVEVDPSGCLWPSKLTSCREITLPSYQAAICFPVEIGISSPSMGHHIRYPWSCRAIIQLLAFVVERGDLNFLFLFGFANGSWPPHPNTHMVIALYIKKMAKYEYLYVSEGCVKQYRVQPYHLSKHTQSEQGPMV